jgi:tRNA(Ser,Leu) C12 N-acetylase TAN1
LAIAVGESDDDSANAQIIKLVQAYEQTAISFTIRRSVRNAEMDLNVTTRQFRIRIVEHTLSNIEEVWNCNVPLGDLSRRRQIRRFGIINSEFRPA